MAGKYRQLDGIETAPNQQPRYRTVIKLGRFGAPQVNGEEWKLDGKGIYPRVCDLLEHHLLEINSNQRGKQFLIIYLRVRATFPLDGESVVSLGKCARSFISLGYASGCLGSPRKG